jgi:K(+)-stimulated pyrophosphate-energized sodium pump
MIELVVILCGLLVHRLRRWAVQSVMASDAGNARMQEIAGAIQEGAQAYLNRQYTTIAIVGACFRCTWLLGLTRGHRLPDRRRPVGCRRLHRHACVRARQCAHRAGGQQFLAPGSKSRSSPAPSPACWWPVSRFWALRSTTHPDRPDGLALTDRTVIDALVALGFGASLISIFARLGGGIFTKGADVGGDLVGKVEAGIPEDDPRNPATIADNVGDNVGDCAGMAADLFETYAVTVVATMVLGVDLLHRRQDT